MVREGALPAGADEAIAEAGGCVLLVGSGTRAAAGELRSAVEVGLAEVGPFAPAAWSVALAPHLVDHDVVVLPASADGRDLAPRLAHALGRPLLAGAILVADDQVALGRVGGLVVEDHVLTGPVVVTLEPGVAGVEALDAAPSLIDLDLGPASGSGSPLDAEVVELVPADVATMDLAEARRIVAGGAGLGSADAFATLGRVATALDASVAASRVVSDIGWAPHDRYIGTTGVVVDPDLYVAFAISGAVQHVSGLGQPDHVVAVNTDASAPMMLMADLAIVTDAVAMLGELAERLEVAG